MAAQLKVIGSGVEVPGMDRQKALEAALAQIDRAFGKGSAMKLGSRENAKVYLKENPEVAQRIENAIRGRTEEVGEALMVGAGPDDDGDDIAAE